MAQKVEYVVNELPTLKKSVANEWIKWLSYMPEIYTKKKGELESKSDYELSVANLRQIKKYNERERLLPLFKNYYDDKCIIPYYRQILSYIKNNSIEDLMLEKLDKEQLQLANKKISDFDKYSREEIERKIKIYEQKENYDKLSMIDSFVFHILSRRYCEYASMYGENYSALSSQKKQI